jgi:hypothetical protein
MVLQRLAAVRTWGTIWENLVALARLTGERKGTQSVESQIERAEVRTVRACGPDGPRMRRAV